MGDYLNRVLSQIIKFFKTQPPAKLIGAILTGATIIGALIAMFMWAGENTYAPLMTNLNPEDAANIIRVLEISTFRLNSIKRVKTYQFHLKVSIN